MSQGAYSGQGTYFLFEKQLNVLKNKNFNSNQYAVNVQHEGILIYFDADNFDSVNYYTSIDKSILVQHL